MPGDFCRVLVFLLVGLPLAGYGQKTLSAESAELAPLLPIVQQFYAASDWRGLLNSIPADTVSPELIFYRGMALARDRKSVV